MKVKSRQKSFMKKHSNFHESQKVFHENFHERARC